MDILKQFELLNGGHKALIEAGELLASRYDANLLIETDSILIKDDYVVWIDPSYPNKGGVYSDIKLKAGESKIMLSGDGDIFEVECIANWDWSAETSIMYEGYQQGLRTDDELEHFLHVDYWEQTAPKNNKEALINE